MDGIGAGKGQGDERVAHFVVSDDLAFLGVQHLALLLQAGHDSLDGQREIFEADVIGAAPRRVKRRFVHEIGEIRAGEARRQRGDLLEIGVARHSNPLRVDLKNLQASDPVRPIDQYLAVEASCAQQCGIEDLGPIRRGEQDQSVA